jgi:hypothetical protein
MQTRVKAGLLIIALMLLPLFPYGQIINPGAGGGGNTCGAPTCTVSTAGTGNGVLALSGNTSGTATITAPAVAGTTTNPIAISNAIGLPDGALATPAITWNNAATTGFYHFAAASTTTVYAAGGTNSLTLLGTGGLRANNAGPFTWTPGTDSTASPDTGISRGAANVTIIGNGTNGDESGLLRWNTCKVTADITLPVNTATTVCSWSLPAVARAWGYNCYLIWTITVGTGTNTMSVGVNASQTPTAATNVAATILATTATLTGSDAAVPLSASGAVNILTSGTYTPAATLEQASSFGTLLASATAGTFAVTMTAAGTTATAAAKAGSTCQLY